jgi:ribosomal protein S13
MLLKKQYGVGDFRMKFGMKELGVPKSFLNFRLRQFNKVIGGDSKRDKCVSKFKDVISGFKIGEDLKRYERERRMFLNSTKSYKAFRFNTKLPCNGQRTKTNASTCKKGVTFKKSKSPKLEKFFFRKFYISKKNNKSKEYKR